MNALEKVFPCFRLTLSHIDPMDIESVRKLMPMVSRQLNFTREIFWNQKTRGSDDNDLPLGGYYGLKHGDNGGDNGIGDGGVAHVSGYQLSKTPCYSLLAKVLIHIWTIHAVLAMLQNTLFTFQYLLFNGMLELGKQSCMHASCIWSKRRLCRLHTFPAVDHLVLVLHRHS